MTNWHGDAALGQAWEGLKTQCGTVKQAAKRGEHGLTPLPKSSVAGHQNDPMCLNWSVLHKCRAECVEAYDHVVQPAAKKEELKHWVETRAKKVPGVGVGEKKGSVVSNSNERSKGSNPIALSPPTPNSRNMACQNRYAALLPEAEEHETFDTMEGIDKATSEDDWVDVDASDL